MSDTIPDRPMSDDFHAAAAELINAALNRDVDPHRHRVAVKWIEAEELVDRLAQALADGQWWSETTTGWRCDSCREAVSLSAVIHPHIVKHHAPDCVYVWATEYVAALEGQNE